VSKGYASILVLAFLLVGMIASINWVQKVDAAQPTIWINANGSITPATTLITTADNITYTLTDNITGTTGYETINVQRDNIIVDGAGYTVQNTAGYSGIWLGDRSNVTVKNVKFTDPIGSGIRLNNNQWITIDNCTFINNNPAVGHGYGTGPKNFTFTNNKVIGPVVVWPTPRKDGVQFSSVYDGLISGNTIQHCGNGVVIYGYENVTIKDNLIDDCTWGIWPLSSDSGINIFGNTFSNNGVSISVGGGAHPTLKIYHNSFFSNNEHARGEGASAEWDDGYPSGGNYWSGYTDVDNNSGPYQNITGVSDGIWDHAYTVDAYGNIDHYPFVSPYETQPPVMTILFPENKTYASSTGIPLTFTVDESTRWMGYSLDGQANVTIAGNTTLPTLSDGPHHVVVYANDTFGNMGMSTAYFTVDTIPPVADAGSAQTVDEDSVVTFDGSASTDENGIATYTWTFTDLTPKTLSGKNPTYTFATPGVYTITLEVTDAAGNTATHTVTITVRDVTKPVANAGSDRTVEQGISTTLDGSASTDNVGVTGYTWTFTDVTVKTLTGDKPAYTFNTPGVYTITLNATDAAGNWATDTVVITVTLDATNPVANAGQDQTVNVGATVTFDAGGSTDNVGIVSYEWDFGDGASGAGKTATHEYTSAGTYTVTLTVKDAAGNQATNTIVVTVTSAEAFSWWILLAAGIVGAGIVFAALIFWRRRKKANETTK